MIEKYVHIIIYNRTAILRYLLEETDLSVPTLLSSVRDIIEEFVAEGGGKEHVTSIRRFYKGEWIPAGNEPWRR